MLGLQWVKIKLDRFSTIDLTIPSQENIAIHLTLLKKIYKPATLPDLAIHPEKDIQQDGDKLMVSVHNIGDGIAENIGVEVMDRNGNVIAEKFISRMEAPVDLIPKINSIEFELNDKKWHRIVIDGEDRIEELYEGNNVAINQ